VPEVGGSLLVETQSSTDQQNVTANMILKRQLANYPLRISDALLDMVSLLFCGFPKPVLENTK
jgi:hypothetical protein